MSIQRILLPNKPHLDPIAALYVLGHYGLDKFPGLFEAQIMFWSASRAPSADELKQFKQDGVLLIDIPGGDFDHHTNNTGVDESVTEIVAKFLGVSENPELVALLNYVREDDLEGLHNRWGDLAYLLKNMYKQNTDQADVVRNALQIVNYFQLGQESWFKITAEEYKTKSQILKIKYHGKNIKLCVIESDDLQVANYAITVDKVSVVAQKRASGHVMILTNKNHRIDLKPVVAAIRARELQLRGQVSKIDWEKLKYFGNSSQISYWFFHRSLNSFLNGSDALNKTEPTKIGWEEMIKIIIKELSGSEEFIADPKSVENKPDPAPEAQGIRAGFLDKVSAPPTYLSNYPSSPLQKGVLRASNEIIIFDDEKLTFMLNVSAEKVDLQPPSDYARENNFSAKKEFHVTIIGFRTAGEIKQILSELSPDERGEILEQIKNLIFGSDWDFQLLPQVFHIKKQYAVGDERESIIQLIQIPALGTFYGRLNSMLGADFDLPPAHITLYTKGTDAVKSRMGICLRTSDELREVTVRKI